MPKEIPTDDPLVVEIVETPDDTPVAPVELKKVPWVNRSTRSLNRVLRTVKMLKPRCEVCAPSGGSWWIRCGHNPYENTTMIHEEIVTTKPHKDGGDEIVDRKQVQRRVLAPNLVEVPTEQKINNGNSVFMQRQRGAKLPAECGYEPVCEFNGCYQSNPGFKTRYGNFCSEMEARLIAARALELPLSINDMRVRDRQLSGVAL